MKELKNSWLPATRTSKEFAAKVRSWAEKKDRSVGYLIREGLIMLIESYEKGK